MSAASSSVEQVPLVVHVIHSLGTGGLENGLVNLINRTPSHRYRHAILCLTESGGFQRRLQDSSVPVVALHQPPGHRFGDYRQVWQMLRQLRPAIVHTRNLSALEAQLPAFLLPGVRRVHGVHGRDVFDLEGRNRKYNLLRKVIRPFVQQYTTVSRDLERWLIEVIGVPPRRVTQIYNGVDQERFHPVERRPLELAPPGFLEEESLVVGTVGRLAAVKDQASLLRAFARLREGAGDGLAPRLRLVLVGDGPERSALEKLADELGIQPVTWFAGDREEIPQLLRLFHLFVLPSLGEGISNTILEAMATGLPVVATRVGGNPELVTSGENGLLVPVADPAALADAMGRLLASESQRRAMGAASLARVRRDFHWDRTVARYLGVYDRLLGNTGQWERQEKRN